MRRLLLALCVLAAGVLGARATRAEVSEVPALTPAESGLELLRSMAGDWYELGPDGEPTDTLMSRVRVTAGGHAVHELHFPDTSMEMLTVYFVEGEELKLVHYCVLGNQPQMRAVELTEDTLAFECTGMDDEDQSHMHGARIESVSEGHNHVEWVNWVGGERNHAVAVDLIRQ